MKHLFYYNQYMRLCQTISKYSSQICPATSQSCMPSEPNQGLNMPEGMFTLFK